VSGNEGGVYWLLQRSQCIHWWGPVLRCDDAKGLEVLTTIWSPASQREALSDLSTPDMLPVLQKNQLWRLRERECYFPSTWMDNLVAPLAIFRPWVRVIK